MKQARLRHVGILISDWDKIRPFYEKLGFSLSSECNELWMGELLMVRKMKNGYGDILEFISGAPWMGHISLTVDKLLDHTSEAICKFNEKVQVKFMQDPEGNWIEFVKEL